jgi:hypothetical protein
VNEERLRELLRGTPTAADRQAEERAWAVVHSAYEAGPAQRRRGGHGRIALALAGATLLLGLLLTPAGADVRDWVRDAINPGVDNGAPALSALPAPGELLVDSARGPWIVHEDGSTRLLGDYGESAFSPTARFVAATSGTRVVAVVADAERTGQPAGTVRWTVTAPRPASDPSWAPSGIRVAYLSGHQLRVVAGDGTDDAALAHVVAPISPAWKPLSDRQERRRSTETGVVPGVANVLAYADRRGRIHVVDVDSREQLARPIGVGGAPLRGLAWAANGSDLWAVTNHGVIGVSLYGHHLERGPAYGFSPARPIAAAPSPRNANDVAALAARRDREANRKSELLLLHGESMRSLSSGPGRFADVAWSPDAHWLLLAWRDADQWLFIRPADGRLIAMDNISEQFDPGGRGRAAFPSIAAWCCQ